MDRNDIIRMAREAGFHVEDDDYGNPMLETASGDLIKFAQLVAAHEREEAAKICEAIAQDHRDQYKGRGQYPADNPRRADPHADGCFDGAGECADAIRSRNT